MDIKWLLQNIFFVWDPLRRTDRVEREKKLVGEKRYRSGGPAPSLYSVCRTERKGLQNEATSTRTKQPPTDLHSALLISSGLYMCCLIWWESLRRVFTDSYTESKMPIAQSYYLNFWPEPSYNTKPYVLSPMFHWTNMINQFVSKTCPGGVLTTAILKISIPIHHLDLASFRTALPLRAHYQDSLLQPNLLTTLLSTCAILLLLNFLWALRVTSRHSLKVGAI